MTRRIGWRRRGWCIILNWRQEHEGGTSGNIVGSLLFDKGKFVSTSPITSNAIDGILVSIELAPKWIWNVVKYTNVDYLLLLMYVSIGLVLFSRVKILSGRCIIGGQSEDGPYRPREVYGSWLSVDGSWATWWRYI